MATDQILVRSTAVDLLEVVLTSIRGTYVRMKLKAAEEVKLFFEMLC